MKAEADEIHQTELSIRGMLALMIRGLALMIKFMS